MFRSTGCESCCIRVMRIPRGSIQGTSPIGQFGLVPLDLQCCDFFCVFLILRSSQENCVIFVYIKQHSVIVWKGAKDMLRFISVFYFLALNRTVNVSEGFTSAASYFQSNHYFDIDKWQKGGKDCTFKDSCFYGYWSELPDIQANAKNEGEIMEINPYLFSHRMALGKCLIQQTSKSRFLSNWSCSMKHEYGKHWYWGYLAQLDWQWRSGRLGPPQLDQNYDAKREDNISKLSWWGFMNLNFTVALYCGAVEAGLVPRVKLIDAEELLDNQSYCMCVEYWKMFWVGAHDQFQSTVTLENFGQAEKKLYEELWFTHSSIIDCSVPYARDEMGIEDLLAIEERNFGLGWCQLVHILAAMNWTLLSLDALIKFGAGYLPTVRIEGEESFHTLRSNRRNEFVSVKSMWALKSFSKQPMYGIKLFWKRISAWDFERKLLPITLNDITLGSSLKKTLVGLRLFIVTALPQSKIDVCLYILAASLGRLWSIVA